MNNFILALYANVSKCLQAKQYVLPNIQEQNHLLRILRCSPQPVKGELDNGPLVFHFVYHSTHKPITNLKSKVLLNRILNPFFCNLQKIFYYRFVRLFTPKWPFYYSIDGFDGIICCLTECGNLSMEAVDPSRSNWKPMGFEISTQLQK